MITDDDIKFEIIDDYNSNSLKIKGILELDIDLVVDKHVLDQYTSDKNLIIEQCKRECREHIKSQAYKEIRETAKTIRRKIQDLPPHCFAFEAKKLQEILDLLNTLTNAGRGNLNSSKNNLDETPSS